MHTIRFLLLTHTYEDTVLDKRFRLLWHIHNQAVKFAQRRLHALFRDRAYIDAKKEYGSLQKQIRSLARRLETMEAGGVTDHKKHAAMKRELAAAKRSQKACKDILNERIEHFELTQTGFDKYVTVMQHRFAKNITSQQAQKEAERVYTGVCKVLYGDGKFVHLKKLADQHTISQKCATNGVKVNMEAHVIEWLGLTVPFKIDMNNPYVAEGVSHTLKYGEIERLQFNNGWRYYLILYLDGPAPKKLNPDKPDGGSVTGIDIGVSTVSSVSQNSVALQELSPQCAEYNRKIAREQRLIDSQKRLGNPDNYDKDGQIKKDRHTWSLTEGCRRRQRKLRTLYRKKVATTEDSHNHQANELILDNGTEFIVEKMNFKGLQKRSQKPTGRQEKTTEIKKKDGTTKTIRKCKRKKRFGKSLNDRAPSSFITILTRKAEQYGGQLVQIKTAAFRASQYQHDTDTCNKVELSDRWKTIDGHDIQRDLYSGFLLMCSNPEGTAPDRDLCLRYFDRFLELHDAFIQKTSGMPHPACFGY